MKLALLVGLILFSACSDKAYKLENDNFILGLENQNLAGSTVEGNLITSAIREVHNLDIVFYPSLLIKPNQFAFLSTTDTNTNDSWLNLYPEGIKDQFIVGNMSGRDLKRFITERSTDNYQTDLQVAGMNYHLHFVGGWLEYAYYSLRNGAALDDKKVYRVAVSKYYYFSGETFPSYKYRNGLGLRDFVEEVSISARESLKTYLNSGREWPFLKEPRATVTNGVIANLGFKKIPEIQGVAHRSPYMGNRVTTRGIVTAVGTVDVYPGGEEAYIQDPKGDGNLLTSDAIHLHYRNLNTILELGDEIEVEGVVYEQQFDDGLGRTSLREISKITVLKKNVELPEPVLLGSNGRRIPDKVISKWRGNLNLKPQLSLNEAIDFYESLEGMRVKIEDARIVGFRGGNEEFYRSRPKGYLNLYVLPNGNEKTYQTTNAGGVIIDFQKNDYNPNIIQIVSNHFSNGIDPEGFYNVGGELEGEIVGIMGYEKNIFGGAEYAMVLPEAQSALSDFKNKNALRTEIEQRPKTTLTATQTQLTVAAYNIENLAGNQQDRLDEIGKSIAVSLKCPDIVSLVEVQDENGTDFSGNASAQVTLERLIDSIPCGAEVSYKPVYSDPFINNDGGQPGGNIQVAFIYNEYRVSFSQRGILDPLMDQYLTTSGRLLNNPSRLYARDAAFKNSRKSLAAEFEFRGEPVFVIGNHFNSKFADTSLWGAEQPHELYSDDRRQVKARRINQFVQSMLVLNPEANIIVLGDFNAFAYEKSMRVLQGEQLQNLSLYKDLIPFNDRYTYNFNGNSQAIDHIFVSKPMLRLAPELQIPHINTDFMGRLADHDPIIARFNFAVKSL